MTTARARIGGFSLREAYRVGVGMISRGEVGIIVALVGYNAGIIDSVVFSVMVLTVLVTTLITPVWLKAAFREAVPPIDGAADSRREDAAGGAGRLAD